MTDTNPPRKSGTEHEQACPRANPDAIEWTRTGFDGRLLLGVPRGAERDEAINRGYWITGRGVDLLEVA